MLLFGEEPAPLVQLVQPVVVLADGADLLIADTALGAVFRWQGATRSLSELNLAGGVHRPVALAPAGNGDFLVADVDVKAVLRYRRTGEMVRRYALTDEPFRPAGVCAVDDQIWVSNPAAQRIDIFAAESGEHLRWFGRRGTGPGEFGIPLGMARTPDGNVCIVDMLNQRVQVFDRTGAWLTYIGQPGAAIGSFARPKDVAVGPDGTVFVTDDASQRVHVLDRDGHPLLAFGEPGSGLGALEMPSGLTLTAQFQPDAGVLPADFTPTYFVFVVEQISRPGIRVYAWSQPSREVLAAAAPLQPRAMRRQPATEEGENPHWKPDQCGVCHARADDRWAPIAPAAVNPLCLDCHDGREAALEPHPVGRRANGPQVTTPPEWPIVDDRLTCLTCHDIIRHCRSDITRPLANPAMVRSNYDPNRPVTFCANCHSAEVVGTLDPHRRQIGPDQRLNEEACLYCHTQKMEIPADGLRRFEPHLRDPTSALCLACHPPHWDFLPGGHVERLVTAAIRARLLERELAVRALAPQQRAALLAKPGREPARLPLDGNRVACYTCHNPHHPNLFPHGSELGMFASDPRSAALSLRLDYIDLCFECHGK